MKFAKKKDGVFYDMYTIVFVETMKSGSSREAIKAAKQLGFLTVLLTAKEKLLSQRKEFPDVSQMVLMKEFSHSQIRMECMKIQKQGSIINGIFSFVDPYVSMAAELMNELCGSDISSEALKKMENKILTRTSLQKNAANPVFEIFNPAEDLNLFLEKVRIFPMIVKSPLSAGSRDVYLVQNKEEMKDALKKISKLYPDRDILIEEFLDGPQFIAEVLVSNGEIHIVAVVEQEVTKKAKFIITGYNVLPKFDEERFPGFHDTVESIIRDLGGTVAACHLEMRFVNEKWKLIEINPRISGGAMNAMIYQAFGINLVEETLFLFLGYEAEWKRKYEKHVYTHYITIDSYGSLLKVTGKKAASSVPGVLAVYTNPRKGTILTPAFSMGQRYGYVMATGETSEEAKKTAILAASKIKFYLEPLK